MRYIAAIILIFASMILISGAQAPTITAQNYTIAYANQTINQTMSYVNLVNQSGYLIFYPNLSGAYAYLAKAQNIYTTSPSSAILYANQAKAIAKEQYAQIGTYRTTSLAVMAILTVAFFIWLYGIMSPMKKIQNRKRR
ncbi:MAG: hypothetical protein ACREBF_04050 [Candidatus Micrarchaeales archaeon]